MASALGLVLGAGCGSQQAQSSGGQCFTSLDCVPGLICLPKGGSGGTEPGICTANTGSIQTEIDAGMDSGAKADAPVAASDSTSPQDTGTTSSPDATLGDTGGPPPHDSGTPPVDTGGPPPKDTGAPPRDGNAG